MYAFLSKDLSRGISWPEGELLSQPLSQRRPDVDGRVVLRQRAQPLHLDSAVAMLVAKKGKAGLRGVK
jgi:hypothetical protein